MTRDIPTAWPTHWDQETDVAVVGGGGSGLAAALEASAQGASVVLLEKQPHLGGTTGIAVGSFTASGTALQKEAGVGDDPAWHEEDLAKFAPEHESKNNAPLRAFLTQHLAENFEWLRGLGLEFGGPNLEPPNRVPRMHNVVPNAKMYIAVCHRRALEQGVQILADHKVTRLFRKPDGAMAGLKARGLDGKVVHFKVRRGIVLAAGDYSNGDAVKMEFVSPKIAAIEGINPTATGDGHRLARDAGAALINMDLVYGPEIRFIPPQREPFAQLLPADPESARQGIAEWDREGDEKISERVADLLVPWQHPENSLYEHGAVLVNANGHRFVDETAAPELAIPRQNQKAAYIVFDRAVAETFSSWPNFVSTAPKIAYAYVEDYHRLRPDLYHEASTIDALAESIGLDSATFASTIHDYNEAAEGLDLDPFGRALFGSSIENPPFYALGPVKSWIVTTEGGVRINKDCAALDHGGEVIPGLYAAGSNGMGGLVLWSHGLHIGWAITSGRIAGRNAAAAA